MTEGSKKKSLTTSKKIPTSVKKVINRKKKSISQVSSKPSFACVKKRCKNMIRKKVEIQLAKIIT